MSAVLESLQIQSRPGDNTGVGTIVATLDEDGLVINSPGTFKAGNAVLPDTLGLNAVLVAASVSSILHIVPEGVWVVDSVTEYHATGSTSGTVTVTVDDGVEAPGAGTAQLTATISLAAAADDTVQHGVLIATPTEIVPGNRVSLLIAGTMTSLVGGGITVMLRKVR